MLKKDEVRIPFLVTKRISKELSKIDSLDGIKIHRLGFPGINRWSEYFFYFMACLFLLRQRNSFDLIHCHATSVIGFMMTMLGRILRKPVVLKLSSNGELLRESWFDRSKQTLLRRVLSKLHRIMAKVTVKQSYIVILNKEGLQEVEKAGSKNNIIIPNGIDVTEYAPLSFLERQELRKKYGFGNEAKIMLFLGRFVYVKGIDILLSAFKEMKNDFKFQNVHLCLVGSGVLQLESLDDHIKKQCEQNKGRIHILQPKIPPVEYYQMADIFVLPSRREGLPNVVLEALGTGLPCILSDIDPHLELKNKNPDAPIKFFKSGDPISLANAMRACLDSIGSDFSTKNRMSYLSHNFNIENICFAYINLYKKLLKC